MHCLGSFQPFKNDRKIVGTQYWSNPNKSVVRRRYVTCSSLHNRQQEGEMAETMVSNATRASLIFCLQCAEYGM